MGDPTREGAGPVLPLDLAAAAANRAGPKAATLARLRGAGLPVPDGFVLGADAYRAHLAAAGVARAAGRVTGADEAAARRLAVEVRLGLGEAPLAAPVAAALEDAYGRLASRVGPLVAVRASALLEEAPGASLAGQLETLLGVGDAGDLLTAVRACWASLWLTRTVRYLRGRGLDPARTAVAVLVQPLVPARAAGGALSRTEDGTLVLTAAWGLGPAVAQGEVVPDRYVLGRDGPLLESLTPGRKPRRLLCVPGQGARWRSVAPALAVAPCLDGAEAVALARLVLAAEATLEAPVEVEWALADDGFHLLQVRRLALEPGSGPERPPAAGAGLSGQPASAGRAVGPVRVVRSEADLVRVGVGDVLVTRVAGPALAPVLPRVAAVVAELGGSTSHLAALARERGIPAVLGVADATRRLAEGRRVLVDGAAGVVHTLP